MPVSIYSSDSLHLYGVNLGPLPPIINVPSGCKVVKIRQRAGEFTTVFLRGPEGFSRWHVNYASPKRTALVLLYPVAANLRPRHSRVA